MAPTILIIDDSPGVRNTFPALLRLESFQAVTAGDGISGIATALTNAFDVILVDHHLPDLSGIDVVKELKRRGIQAPIVVYTAFPEPDSAPSSARVAGAAGYVEGPLWGDEVCAVVRQALSGALPLSCTPSTLHAPSVAQPPSPAHPVTDARLRHVVRMIEADPRLSAEDLARRVGLSESRLRHMFTQDLGVSLVRFARSLRVDRGAWLLRTTFEGISQVADRLALPNFRRAFRARFGMSSQEYRARYRSPGPLR